MEISLSLRRSQPARIQTQKKQNGIFHDDSTTLVKAHTLDELHSLQKKKYAPSTPIKGSQLGFAAQLSKEERHKQQLQPIRFDILLLMLLNS